MISLALYQPEIPANTGTLIRLSACLNVTLHIIGPTGFAMNERALKRAGMDYSDMTKTVMHRSAEDFLHAVAWERPRLILATTKAQTAYTDVSYAGNDLIIMGRESAGAPDWLHKRADMRVRIPLVSKARSLNLAVSASMIVGEALRQTRQFAG
ncbi:MAG: tRNA (cytidine(34)-2'-O)-methyltransferase [Pseudomonadota bacterium]